MKLVEKRSYRASPEDIWGILQDPENMPAWNPKCLTVEGIKRQEVGQKFSVCYEMNGKRSNAMGELAEYEKNRRIAFRYHYEAAARTGIVMERFEVTPGNGMTQVVHTVDFSQSSLPLWLKWLISFFNKFGRKRGAGSLDGIADLLGE
ncbi:MAG: SRPBCC family protein [Opitutales bacterium]